MDPNSSPSLAASFRDPSGFMFQCEGVLYRQVNKLYQEHYERLINSGLYQKLVDSGWLIPHREVAQTPPDPVQAFCVLQPEPLKFISYPYEWSFSQLQDAALVTLSVQKKALEAGMSLKDASAYNIQFHRGLATLIDTLSFEIYREGEPWVAYRQFCQHFLAPLALMALCDVRLSQLLRVYIDGIPLDLASRLLPGRTRFDLGLATHIHLHAASQKRYADKIPDKNTPRGSMSKLSFLGLLDSLESTVRRLRWQPAGTEWGNYYDANAGHYTNDAMEHKRQVVSGFLERIRPASVWDLGANTGIFSRLASQRGIPTVAFDIDPAAVERNYRLCRVEKIPNLLPLVLDLTNPSPGIGWHNRERHSLLERAPADGVLALALMHHLAITNNVPLPRLAEFFKDVGRWLVIEFVPKEDPQVKRLLATRADIFPDYTTAGFEAAFAERFILRDQAPVIGSPRTLYLMENKAGAG